MKKKLGLLALLLTVTLLGACSGADGVARVAGSVSTARHTAALLVFLSLGGPPSR